MAVVVAGCVCVHLKFLETDFGIGAFSFAKSLKTEFWKRNEFRVGGRAAQKEKKRKESKRNENKNFDLNKRR